ncbi:hypothetical protein JG688_00007715, partial [Phytophthora aleatoria]
EGLVSDETEGELAGGGEARIDSRDLSASDLEVDADSVPVTSEAPVSATASNSTPNAVGAAYVKSLIMQSGVHVVAEAKVVKAYRDNAEYGKFSLFFTT